MVTLGQLWARHDLDLDVVVDPPGARTRPITTVHSSELPEVDQWLAGGEVLLTIGVGQDLGAEAVAGYVARLRSAGVQALGIGLGAQLPWSTIPDVLRRAAEAECLALFGVPEPVPFVAVVDAFTRLREDEANRELTRASSAGRRFATALAAHGPSELMVEVRESLNADADFVSPTGRGLAGPDADHGVRLQLIEQSVRHSFVPRLLDLPGGRRLEAIPVGDDSVRGWVLSPVAPESSPRLRSLMLSTAVALLGLTLAEAPPRREETTLFTVDLTPAEAKRAWVADTRLAAVSRAELSIFSAPHPSVPLRLLDDLGPSVPVARSGTMIGVLHSGRATRGLVDAAATATGIERLFRRTLDLADVHHTWMVWGATHSSQSSELATLLSAVDDGAAREFVDRVLGPLLASADGQTLLPTLRAFVAAGGVRDRIAADLGVHRHTVRARLMRLEAILGRDLTEPASVQTIAVALGLVGH